MIVSRKRKNTIIVNKMGGKNRFTYFDYINQFRFATVFLQSSNKENLVWRRPWQRFDVKFSFRAEITLYSIFSDVSFTFVWDMLSQSDLKICNTKSESSKDFQD